MGQLIVTGELKAGDRIQELRVASELNVSRGSVREAYLIMQRRHLIDIIPRKGAVVSSMTAKHVKNIYELNVLLLGRLCHRATLVWKEGELDPFMELLATMEGYVKQGRVMEFYDATFTYARMAYRFADNIYLEEMLEDLQPAVRRTYYYAINIGQAEIERSMLFFRELMVAVFAREPDSAVRVLQQFGEHQCNAVLACERFSQIETV